MNCPVCTGYTISLGEVPFDRNNAGVAVIDTTPVEYRKCTNCWFVYSPEMLTWTPEQLGARVYNSDYVLYDPDYAGSRPRNYANAFMQLFNGRYPGRITHLDYGSGSGIMSHVLNNNNWNSTSYDPYSDNTKPTTKFDLVTAIEVFEHSLDIDKTIKDIKSYLNPQTGVIIFSTQLATQDTDISWWYIGARNGHIGILSAESLKVLAIRNKLYFGSINPSIHVLQPNKNNFKNLLGAIHGVKP